MSAVDANLLVYAHVDTSGATSSIPPARRTCLQVEVREMDMRAGPYDLRELGYDPVPIETPAGRAQYAAAQARFAERAAPLRQRLIELCDILLTCLAPRRSTHSSRSPLADRPVC